MNWIDKAVAVQLLCSACVVVYVTGEKRAANWKLLAPLLVTAAWLRAAWVMWGNP